MGGRAINEAPLAYANRASLGGANVVWNKEQLQRRKCRDEYILLPIWLKNNQTYELI